jgi:GNAT superfamily N-acetyltransferase
LKIASTTTIVMQPNAMMAQGLGFVIRDEVGQMIGVAAGYTWAGTSELKQMWIDKAYRGRGYARALLNAFVLRLAAEVLSGFGLRAMTFELLKCMKRPASSVWPSLKGGRRATPMLFSARHYQVGKTEAPTWRRGPMSGSDVRRAKAALFGGC